MASWDAMSCFATGLVDLAMCNTKKSYAPDPSLDLAPVDDDKRASGRLATAVVQPAAVSMSGTTIKAAAKEQRLRQPVPGSSEWWSTIDQADQTVGLAAEPVTSRELPVENKGFVQVNGAFAQAYKNQRAALLTCVCTCYGKISVCKSRPY